MAEPVSKKGVFCRSRPIADQQVSPRATQPEGTLHLLHTATSPGSCRKRRRACQTRKRSADQNLQRAPCCRKVLNKPSLRLGDLSGSLRPQNTAMCAREDPSIRVQSTSSMTLDDFAPTSDRMRGHRDYQDHERQERRDDDDDRARERRTEERTPAGGSMSSPRRSGSTGSSRKGKERARDPLDGESDDEQDEDRRRRRHFAPTESVAGGPKGLRVSHPASDEAVVTAAAAAVVVSPSSADRAVPRSNHPLDRNDPPAAPTPPPPPLAQRREEGAAEEAEAPLAPGTTATAPIALQSILKRPPPARLSSSSNSRFSYGSTTATTSPLVSISPAPPSPRSNSATATAIGGGGGVVLLPTLISTPSRDDDREAPSSPSSENPAVDDEEDRKAKLARPGVVTHGVLFSTPGTTTSVLPLSSPSFIDSNNKYNLDDHGPADPTGTFKSWKSSMMGRRSGMYDRKKLAALGFEEELTRDYDFWASWGIALCNIGGLPGQSTFSLGDDRPRSVSGADNRKLGTDRLRPRSPDRARSRRRIHVRHRVAHLGPLHGLARRHPRRNGLDVARRRGHVHVGVSTLSESQGVEPVGAVCELDRRESVAVLASLVAGAWAAFRSVRGPAFQPGEDACSRLMFLSAAQIVVTWQFAHNVLGVVGLYTEKDYNHWVTIALGWVGPRFHLDESR